MKKLLFCLQTMVCGGVEKELITILKHLDKNKYSIEVILFYVQDEEIIKEIPSDVKLTILNINKKYWVGGCRDYIASRLRRGHFFEAVKIAFMTAVSKGASAAHISLESLPSPMVNYDIAVCYHMHSPLALRYVAEKVNADKKCIWIHNDFINTGFAVQYYQKALISYNSIIAVSDKIKSEFLKILPDLSTKILTIHDVVDPDEVLKKAKDFTDDDFSEDDSIKLVTVGRYVSQKGYDIAIESCRYLREWGINASWYAIGWGPAEDSMRQEIKSKHLEPYFHILGKKENPYPYIYGADIYVQPSRHEGFCLTLKEAIILGKYVVTTNFAGASEQITNERMGVIVDSFDPRDIAVAIRTALTRKHDYPPVIRNEWSEFEKIFE